MPKYVCSIFAIFWLSLINGSPSAHPPRSPQTQVDLLDAPWIEFPETSVGFWRLADPIGTLQIPYVGVDGGSITGSKNCVYQTFWNFGIWCFIFQDEPQLFKISKIPRFWFSKMYNNYSRFPRFLAQGLRFNWLMVQGAWLKGAWPGTRRLTNWILSLEAGILEILHNYGTSRINILESSFYYKSSLSCFWNILIPYSIFPKQINGSWYFEGPPSPIFKKIRILNLHNWKL